MKATLITMFLLAPILAFVPNIRGQKLSQNSVNNLTGKFEKVITDKEPKFKIVRGIVVEQRANEARLVWRLDKDSVFVRVTDYYNLKAASTAMSNHVTAPRPLFMMRTKLTDLGDEAYFTSGRDSAGITFRKGTVIISISAVNAAIVRRFARHFAEEME